MSLRIFVRIAVVSVVFALLAATQVVAQGADPSQVAGPAGGGGPVASTISYQGVLKEGGLPVSGSRDMIFRLYLDPDCITQTGADILSPGVAVSGGFFTTYLDVPHATFTGRGLWLKAFVGGVGLGCQTILPAPYALSLRPGASIESYETGSVLRVLNSGTGDGIHGWTASGYAGVYGQSDAHYGVWGQGRFGVFGLTFDSGGIGVRGRSGTASGVTYGVNGVAESPSGYAGYFENTGGGVDIRAAGSGIIQSVAETRIALTPFEIEATSELANNLNLRFLHHWLGYNQITTTSAPGSHTVYLPAQMPTLLFGTATKLKGVEVCYKVANAASYIDITKVYAANGAGGRPELLTSDTHRTQTSFNCYTVTATTPPVIPGPLMVWLNMWFAGTGDSHAIYIDRITAILTE